MSKQIRPYQQNAINAVYANLQKGIDKNLVCMATGTGKTFTAIKLIEQLQFKKTLFLTDRDELCNQSALAFIRDKFDERFSNHVDELGFVKYVQQGGLFAGGDFKMGLIKGDIFKPEGDVVIASAHTIHNRLHLLDPKQYDCVVVDECHKFGSKSLYKGLSFFEPRLRCGLSATPFRTSGVLMGDIFDVTAFEYNLQEAIRDGNLCELDAIRIKTNLSLDDVHTVGGEFNQKELADEVNCYKRNKLIVDSYIKYCSGIQGIFFCVDIQHCLDLVELFIEAGINAKAVSSDEERTPNSSEHIKAFKKGQIDVLVNVDLMTTGVDVPDAGCIGDCAPTKSIVKFFQRIGRGTRLKTPEFVSKFGQKCIILDFLDNTTRHNIINTWSLDHKLPPEERIFLTSENRNKLIAERLKRNSKVDIKRNEDEFVNLLSLPKVKLILSSRMNEPATDKQLLAIKNWGFDIDNTYYTKAQVNDIFMSQPASDKEIAFIKSKGYKVDGFVSKAIARKASEEINNRKTK